MSDYCLSCCSAVDLTPKQMEQRNIHYVCFQYTVDEEVYADDMGVSMSSEELFERMAHGAKTKTSQISVARYIQYFEPFLKEGMDILHVTLSSGITGTYNSACVARSELLERYPERKIFIVDSLAASSGYGLLMNALADQRDMGKSKKCMPGRKKINAICITGFSPPISRFMCAAEESPELPVLSAQC